MHCEGRDYALPLKRLLYGMKRDVVARRPALDKSLGLELWMKNEMAVNNADS